MTRSVADKFVVRLCERSLDHSVIPSRPISRGFPSSLAPVREGRIIFHHDRTFVHDGYEFRTDERDQGSPADEQADRRSHDQSASAEGLLQQPAIPPPDTLQQRPARCTNTTSVCQKGHGLGHGLGTVSGTNSSLPQSQPITMIK